MLLPAYLQSATPRLHLHALTLAAEFAHQRNDLDESVQRWQQVISGARDIHDANTQLRAYLGLGHATEDMARFDEAEDSYRHALDLAMQLRERFSEAAATLALGRVAQRVGDVRRALRYYRHAEEIYQELEGPSGKGRRTALRGRILALIEARIYAEGLQAAQDLLLLEEAEFGADHADTIATRALTAVLLEATGHHDAAIEQVDRIAASFHTSVGHFRVELGPVLMWSAQMMDHSQMTGSAETLLRALMVGLHGDQTPGGLSVRLKAYEMLTSILVRQRDQSAVDRHIEAAREDFAADVGQEEADNLAMKLRALAYRDG